MAVYSLSKMSLVNYSDTTSSSVFSHHTGIRLEEGFVRTQRTPPGSATDNCAVNITTWLTAAILKIVIL